MLLKLPPLNAPVMPVRAKSRDREKSDIEGEFKLSSDLLLLPIKCDVGSLEERRTFTHMYIATNTKNSYSTFDIAMDEISKLADGVPYLLDSFLG